MFDYIDSKYTKSRYEEVGFMLTDTNAATLIWNKYTLSYEDKMSALAKLGETTSDIELKRQIAERVDYENLILREFIENQDSETIYMVRDWEDEEVYGLFSMYDTALEKAKKVGDEDGVDMLIEKHIIVTGDTIPKMKNMGRLNPNLFPDEEEMWMEYSGSPIAGMHLNPQGEIMSLWSDELSEEERKVDSFNKKRFEFKYFNVPYVHQKGLLVKNTYTGKYGIIETSEEDWNTFLERVKNGLYVDYSDIVHTVYCLTERGYWSHEHWNPMEMETEMPITSDFSDKKAWALAQALDAMSNYMSGYTGESQVKIVLRTTREYAKICKEMTEFEKIAREAEKVEDILF